MYINMFINLCYYLYNLLLSCLSLSEELHQSFDQHRLSTNFIEMAMKYMEAEELMTITFAQERHFHCFKNTAKSIYDQINSMHNKGMSILLF